MKPENVHTLGTILKWTCYLVAIWIAAHLGPVFIALIILYLFIKCARKSAKGGTDEA
jgi:hypothetical protein